MNELPEIKRKAKKPKAPYRKPDAVKLLEELAMDEARLKHPGIPHLAPALLGMTQATDQRTHLGNTLQGSKRKD